MKGAGRRNAAFPGAYALSVVIVVLYLCPCCSGGGKKHTGPDYSIDIPADDDGPGDDPGGHDADPDREAGEDIVMGCDSPGLQACRDNIADLNEDCTNACLELDWDSCDFTICLDGCSGMNWEETVACYELVGCENGYYRLFGCYIGCYDDHEQCLRLSNCEDEEACADALSSCLLTCDANSEF